MENSDSTSKQPQVENEPSPYVKMGDVESGRYQVQDKKAKDDAQSKGAVDDTSPPDSSSTHGIKLHSQYHSDLRSCCTTVRTWWVSLFQCIVVSFIMLAQSCPVVSRILEIIFWWKFSAARGKELECDLQMDTFYWFSTVILLLSTIGTLKQPTFDSNPTPWTPQKALAIVLVLMEFYFGFAAVVWIPDEATCPETAPELFQAAYSYLRVKILLLVYGFFSVCTLRAIGHHLLRDDS